MNAIFVPVVLAVVGVSVMCGYIDLSTHRKRISSGGILVLLALWLASTMGCTPPPVAYEGELITPSPDTCTRDPDIVVEGWRVQLRFDLGGRLGVLDFRAPDRRGEVYEATFDRATAGIVEAGSVPKVKVRPGMVCTAGEIRGNGCLEALWPGPACWSTTQAGVQQ